MTLVRGVAFCLVGGCALLTACETPTEQARSVFREELISQGYQPFDPIREGIGIGSIITYDRSGREVVVANAEQCFPEITGDKPPKRPAVLFQGKYERLREGNLGVSAAQLNKSIADLSFALEASSEVSVDMQFVKPNIRYLSVLEFEALLAKLSTTNAACYRAALDPKNIVIIHTLGVAGAQYTFKDKSNRGINLSASILDKAKVAPSIRQKLEGQSSLDVDQEMVLGYRALEFRKGSGLNNDGTVAVGLSLDNLRAFRASRMQAPS